MRPSNPRKDLFGYTKPDAAAGYIRLRDAKDGPDFIMRCQLQKMWGHFFIFADDQFTKEFATKYFNQRYWEMYLGFTLVESGFSLNNKKSGPDICLELPDCVVWIEATCPTIGSDQNADQVPKLLSINEDAYPQPTPSDQIILRLLQGLDEKTKKIRSYIEKGTIGADDAVVLAISGSDLDHWVSHESSHEYLLRALFPLGQPVLYLDKTTFNYVGSGFQFSDSVTRRKNAIQVPKDFFGMADNSGISAVLWSSRRPGHLQHERFGDDFVLVRNPRARNKLPNDFIKIGREIEVNEDNFQIVDHRNK